MDDSASRIGIAAALIQDDTGGSPLMRKAGAQRFMQAGGRIENEESPLHALKRERIRKLACRYRTVPYLGCFSSIAANEPDEIAEAEALHVRCNHDPS